MTTKIGYAPVRRSVLMEEPLYKWGDEERRWLNAFLIFPTKGRAKKWINHWLNKEDFIIKEVKILV